MNIEQAIPLERVSGSSFVAVLLYFPIGLLLALFRLFLTINFLCSQLFFNVVLSKSNYLRRAYERIFLTILGVVLVEKNSELRDEKSILVSNSVSNIDGFFISILSNCYAEQKKQLSLIFMSLFRLHAADNTLPRNYQVLVQPEPQPTDGKSLLKFSNLTSPHTTSHVQPVAIKLYRPFSISGTTIDSSAMWDLIWMYFSIFNVYQVKYLPVLHKNQDDTLQDFSERIRKPISDELNIECTSYDASDIKEFIRRRNFEARKPQEHLRATANSSPLIREMVQQVKDVLPHVPRAVIIKDLERTRSVDVTVTNLLEGVVSFVPETAPTTSKTKPLRKTFSPPAKKRISSNPKSFQERKEAFIEQARENYLKKRGLM